MGYNKNFNRLLFTEINIQIFILISVVIPFAIVFYTFTDRISLMFVSIVLGLLLITFWLSKLNSKLNEVPFTVIQYLQDLEYFFQEIKIVGKQFVNIAKRLKRSFIVLISMFVFSRYFIDPIASFLTTYIENSVIDIILTVFRVLEFTTVATLIVLTLALLLWVGNKCISLKFASNDMKNILDELSEINVPVQFKHVNGVRLLQVDHLLDHLIEIDSAQTMKIYRQIKRMYKYIPDFELLPSHYDKSVFRNFNKNEIHNVLTEEQH